MASQTVVTYVDDLDGSAADERVTLSLGDGWSWELDLSTAHADELRAVLAPYTDAGRRVRSVGAGGRTGRRLRPTG